MTITNVKAMITKAATIGFIAAAFAIATPAKANAQFAVGVRIGTPAPYYGHVRPIYAPPAYGGPVFGGYYGGYGYDRHLAWERHERFERDHRFYGR